MHLDSCRNTNHHLHSVTLLLPLFVFSTNPDFSSRDQSCSSRETPVYYMSLKWEDLGKWPESTQQRSEYSDMWSPGWVKLWKDCMMQLDRTICDCLYIFVSLTWYTGSTSRASEGTFITMVTTWLEKVSSQILSFLTLMSWWTMDPPSLYAGFVALYTSSHYPVVIGRSTIAATWTMSHLNMYHGKKKWVNHPHSCSSQTII